MGVIGAGICTNITEMLRFSYIFFYASCFNPYPKSHVCPNKDTFKNFGRVLKLTAASAALFFGESAGYNIVEFITARLGVTPFGQHIALMNITMITFAFALGFLNTNAILIGNYAAQNSPKNVKKIIKISFYASLVAFIPILIMIATFSTSFLRFFAESDDIWNSDGMATIVYIMCIGNFFDFQQSNIQGYLRGLGVLNTTFIVSFSSYCVVLPVLCYTLAHSFDLGLKGVWISMLIVNIAVFVMNGLILAKCDIDKLCENYEDEDAIGEDESIGNNQIDSASTINCQII